MNKQITEKNEGESPIERVRNEIAITAEDSQFKEDLISLCNAVEILQRENQHLRKSGLELDEYRNGQLEAEKAAWQFCEECNTPTQNLGVGIGRVCLVCDLRDDKNALTAKVAELQKFLRDANRGAETNAHALRISSERNLALLGENSVLRQDNQMHVDRAYKAEAEVAELNAREQSHAVNYTIASRRGNQYADENEKLRASIAELEHDRDLWKRACERLRAKL